MGLAHAIFLMEKKFKKITHMLVQVIRYTRLAGCNGLY